MPRRLATLVLAVGLAADPAAAQTQQMSFLCDLQGAKGQLNVALEYVSSSGLTWGSGPNPGITGVIPTEDFTLYTAGELRSATAYYTFTGEGAFAQFTDHVQGGQFTVQFVEQPGGLVLVANPYGPGPASYFCRRVQ